MLSGGAIVLLPPVLGVISLAIKLDSPGPVLFKQKRVGRNCEFFEIWKFRSMRTDTPKDMPTHMLRDPDAFITKTGKFLRKTSLDKLPQIWLMPIALKKEQATVDKCLMMLTQYPLKPDFPYWSQNAGSVLSILMEKHPHEESIERWNAIERFVRTAQKFTIRISSLKKDLVDAKGNGKTYFEDVNESSMNKPYIGFAQDVLIEMNETIEKLPDDLPIRSLK